MESTTRVAAHPTAATDTDHTPGAPAQSRRTDASAPGLRGDLVEEWGRQSFPASDPPSNW